MKSSRLLLPVAGGVLIGTAVLVYRGTRERADDALQGPAVPQAGVPEKKEGPLAEVIARTKTAVSAWGTVKAERGPERPTRFVTWFQMNHLTPALAEVFANDPKLFEMYVEHQNALRGSLEAGWKATGDTPAYLLLEGVEGAPDTWSDETLENLRMSAGMDKIMQSGSEEKRKELLAALQDDMKNPQTASRAVTAFNGHTRFAGHLVLQGHKDRVIGIDPPVRFRRPTVSLLALVRDQSLTAEQVVERFLSDQVESLHLDFLNRHIACQTFIEAKIPENSAMLLCVGGGHEGGYRDAAQTVPKKLGLERYLGDIPGMQQMLFAPKRLPDMERLMQEHLMVIDGKLMTRQEFVQYIETVRQRMRKEP